MIKSSGISKILEKYSGIRKGKNKMKKDREKEIKYLMYLKSEIIKQNKKELKELKRELKKLNNKNK